MRAEGNQRSGCGEKMIKPDFKVNKEVITLSYRLKKGEEYKINSKENIFYLIINKKFQQVIGITSMCEDGRHIIMIDWDNTCKWIVLNDIQKIIGLFDLSPFYLFTTKEKKIENEIVGNYHSICLTKLHPHEIVGILNKTHCDYAYQTMPTRNIFRSWVLRTSYKGKREPPKFLEIIGKDNLKNQVSQAHLNILTNLYKLPYLMYANKDGLKKYYVNIYDTGNL